MSTAVAVANENIASVQLADLPAVGGALAGGYYTGIIKIGDCQFALITSGAAGHLVGKLQPDLTAVDGARDRADGRANTVAFAAAGSALAKAALELIIDGFSDWYIPSRDEARRAELQSIACSMIGRRKSPDGLPFRLYIRVGKFKTSVGYKLPDGSWAFRLSAQTNNKEAVAAIRKEGIERAEVLNGKVVGPDTVAALFKKYFTWQDTLPRDSENRKTDGTLDENKREAKNILAVFGEMQPADIRPVDIYGYLSARELAGAPAKANKEIALLSAVLEYGRRLGWLETNPCRGIKYNKTRPKQKTVEAQELDLVLEVGRERGGSYRVLALCLSAAYLTVSRPDETRAMTRSNLSPQGIRMAVGKRKAGHMQRTKLIEWSPRLKAIIDEALAIQRTPSMYVFGNTHGQVYTTSGFNTILRRLMKHCAAKAEKSGASFTRFTLADMRPTAVTDRMDEGDQSITDATGHSDDRMVRKVYDRRKTKVAKATK